MFNTVLLTWQWHQKMLDTVLTSYYFQSTQLIKRLQKEKASQIEILPALQSQQCQGARLYYKCFAAWPSLFSYCGPSEMAGEGTAWDWSLLCSIIQHLFHCFCVSHKQTPITKFLHNISSMDGELCKAWGLPLFAVDVHWCWFGVHHQQQQIV